MSITRKIIDGAKSGLSQLTQLVVVDDEPLSHVEAAALEGELQARRAARDKRGRSPGDNPVAKLAAPSAGADRARMAAERSGRVKRERSEREAKQKAAADEAFRRMKAQAERGPGPGASAGAGPRTSSGRSPRSGRDAAQIAEWYRTLDLTVGADLAEIKSAYRKMMRKYHPDLHAGNAQKQKAATELSMRVTAAYNGLTAHLEDK